MKKPTKSTFKAMLITACYCTDLQESQPFAGVAAWNLWNIIDLLRKEYPELKEVFITQKYFSPK